MQASDLCDEGDIACTCECAVTRGVRVGGHLNQEQRESFKACVKTV